MDKEERIAKRIARAGLCSRRDAEQWIADGRVSVNGTVLNTPAFKVSSDDKILVDGKALREKEETQLFLYHKPDGLVTTHKDEKGRKTVFESLPAGTPRLISVGRLDLNTEGLLLLTNDGELSRYLELPATGWVRQYRVRVHGRVNEQKLKNLKNGIKIDGIAYKSIDAKIDPQATEKTGTNTWLHVKLREGKNREIRRIMEALDLKVTRLIRTAYGPFNLGKLGKGKLEHVPTDIMREQIKKFFKSGA